MSAEIVQLPLTERSCYNCENGAFSPHSGTFCLMFKEAIIDERLAAADCDAFQPADD